MDDYETVLRNEVIPLLERMSNSTKGDEFFVRGEGYFFTGIDKTSLPNGGYVAQVVNTGELTVIRVQPSDALRFSIFDDRVKTIFKSLEERSKPRFD
ncbi:MAG: hypothetical protein AABW82_02345 [Nanoarchaeota archaeon]